MTNCPCGSNLDYTECCEPFLEGRANPDTPEKLMRSRYVAFVRRDIDYIAKTMKGKAAGDFDREETLRWMNKCDWKKLTVLQNSIDPNDPKKGSVEFIVDYREKDQPRKMHELSQFKFIEGKWYYVDGRYISDTIVPHKSTKVGRNEPCLCGSGKKYKKCCGKG